MPAATGVEFISLAARADVSVEELTWVAWDARFAFPMEESINCMASHGHCVVGAHRHEIRAIRYRAQVAVMV